VGPDELLLGGREGRVSLPHTSRIPNNGRLQSAAAKSGSGEVLEVGVDSSTAAVDPNRMHISALNAWLAKRRLSVSVAVEGVGFVVWLS
jgi:hypothetical protein